MPDKPKTKQFDYARRLYMSKEPYTEQVRMTTDAFRDRTVKKKHSEDKKPYLDPKMDYPEMEGFNFDWDPHWPNLPTIPDDPTVNNLPDVDGTTYTERDPDRRDNRFLGCNFYQPFVPNRLNPGETAWAKLQRLDDPVISMVVHGPGTIISRGNALCTAAGQELFRNAGRPGGGSSPECTVILKVWDDISQFQPDSTGGVRIVVVAQTESGKSCSTEVTVNACPALVPLEWDTSVSPETLAPGNSAVVGVKGGIGPYKWSITGTGVALNPSRGKTTLLTSTSGFCGTAEITVEDSCGEVVSGGVRSTAGSLWRNIDPYVCLLPGPYMYSTWELGYYSYHRMVGGVHCYDYGNPWWGGYASCADCLTTYCPAASMDACDHHNPANYCDPCITNIPEGEIINRFGSGLHQVTSYCMARDNDPTLINCVCTKMAVCQRWECA